MALVAGGVACSRLRLDPRRLESILRRQEPAATDRSSALTARALAGAGFVALLTLPALLVASLIVEAPLAGPALIACGYLVIAHAWKNSRRAAMVNATVLVALVGWSAGILFFLEDPFSTSGLAAALLAPLFAAAPAVTRAALKPDQDRLFAAESVACLDRFAPSEAVLILDKSGRLCAATQSACVAIGAPPSPSLVIGEDVTRRFALTDRRILLDALAGSDSKPSDLSLHVLGEAEDPTRVLAAALSPYRDETIAMHIREAVLSAPGRQRPAERCEGRAEQPLAHPASAHCDIRDTIAFAMRRAATQADRFGVRLIADAPDQLAAACEPQVGRRIVSTMLDRAVMRARNGGTVSIIARQGRGVVLLRVAIEDFLEEENGGASEIDGKLATARALVEQVGGTILVERSSQELRMSVRLALAEPSRRHEASG
jgi:hypothetical protein